MRRHVAVLLVLPLALAGCAAGSRQADAPAGHAPASSIGAHCEAATNDVVCYGGIMSSSP